MTNLNLIFNKLYYDKIGANSEILSAYFTSINQTIAGAQFHHATDYVELPFEHQNFLLQTAYPGLIVGSGNPHGSNQCKEEVNMGFSFDYVSGQPFIPSSSIKGMLRSCFTDYPDEVARLAGLDHMAAVAALEIEIFDGADIFLDAVMYDGDDTYHTVGFDSITPHPSATKNPIPISIIKILPCVKLEFRFVLKDSSISATEKLTLFKELLKTFGIGAKTNVGYGILSDCDTSFKTQNSTTHAPQNSKTRSGEITMKICPHCGRKNFKYRRIDNITTDQVNWNWEKNICFSKECRGSLE